MRRHPLTLLIAAVLCLAPSFVLAQEAPPAMPPADAATSDEVAASDDPDAADTGAAKVPLDEIRRYVMVYNAVKQAYVDPVDDRELMQSAVRGLLLDLDPHSAYLQKAPGAYFNVGAASEAADSHWPHHHPRFTIDETSRYAGSYGDPARMATNYAGVVSTRDNRNDIVTSSTTRPHGRFAV